MNLQILNQSSFKFLPSSFAIENGNVRFIRHTNAIVKIECAFLQHSNSLVNWFIVVDKDQVAQIGTLQSSHVALSVITKLKPQSHISLQAQSNDLGALRIEQLLCTIMEIDQIFEDATTGG
jgi:hypothetical protein